MTAPSEVRRTLLPLSVDRGAATLHAIVAEPENPAATIVLGHGAGGSHLAFFYQIERLSRTHRVVAWDQRGFGASAGVADPIAAAEDVAALLDAVGVERAHLLGQSMSGWTVVGAALRYPDRVSALVLSATVAGMFTGVTLASADAFLLGMSAGSPPVVGRSAALAPGYAEREPTLAVLSQLVGLLPGPGAEAVRLIRNTVVSEAEVAALGLPILFIVGELDPVFPAGEVVALAGRLGARAVIVPGSGHSPYLEAPNRFTTEVARFFSEIEASLSDATVKGRP